MSLTKFKFPLYFLVVTPLIFSNAFGGGKRVKITRVNSQTPVIVGLGSASADATATRGNTGSEKRGKRAHLRIRDVMVIGEGDAPLTPPVPSRRNHRSPGPEELYHQAEFFQPNLASFLLGCWVRRGKLGAPNYAELDRIVDRSYQVLLKKLHDEENGYDRFQGNLRAYLFGIGYNIFRDYTKSPRSRPTVDVTQEQSGDDAFPQPLTEYYQNVNTEELLLKELEWERIRDEGIQGEILYMYYYEGWTDEEIGKELNIPRSTIQKWRCQGIQKNTERFKELLTKLKPRFFYNFIDQTNPDFKSGFVISQYYS